MAAYTTFTPVHQVESDDSFSIDRRNTFSASILAGFVMFGLAANGMCLSSLAGSFQEVSKVGFAVETKPKSGIRTERGIKQVNRNCPSFTTI